MKIQHFLIAAMTLFSFSHCNNKENLFPDLPMQTLDQGTMVSTSIKGYVYGENNQVIQNALVRLGSMETSTNLNGVFSFNNVQTYSRDTYLTIEKDGHLQGARRIYPADNSSINLRIKLLNENVVKVIEADMGGTASLDNGATVVLPANAVVKADGTPYNGKIYVGLRHLAPNDPDLYEKIPGDLSGIDKDGNYKVLATYGMLGVELQSNTSEALQIAPGATATLTFPLPEDLSSQAPETIPLWYFDQEQGRWLEEGSAILEGDVYVGQVSHFSFWNCDFPYKPVYLEGSVIDENGAPLNGLLVRAKIVSNAASSAGATTDAMGLFGGIVPKDELLEISVILSSQSCPELILHTAEYGPFSENTTLDPIQVSIEENSFLINGSLKDCAGAAVEDGYIGIEFPEGYELLFTEDGNFAQYFPICTDLTTTITGYDPGNGKTSTPMSYDFNADLPLGAILVCDDDLTEYLEMLSIGSTPKLFTHPILSRTAQATTILSSEENGFKRLTFEGTEAGTYPLSPTSTFSENNDIEITITNYGAFGEFITGTYEGFNYWNGTPFEVSGSFRILNDAEVQGSENCPLPETSFVGAYNLEVITGGENCFGPIFDTETAVELTYVSTYEREAHFKYLPSIGNFETELYFMFSCGKVYVHLNNTGFGCSSSILQSGGLPLESFDQNDDSVFQFNLTDFVNEDCGCPAYPGNVFRLTKQ